MQSHQYSIEELFSLSQSSERGLSVGQAKDRLVRNGKNEILAIKPRSVLWLFLEQFADFMIVVLMLAAVISWVLGDAIDTYVILGIVIMNAVIGFIQEYRAEKAMESLKRMASPFARVLRESKTMDIDASELVVGDLVIIEAGNVVPADLRVISSSNLRADEAALTGESNTVEKHSQTLHQEFLPIGDRSNMLFKGTSVTHGSGRGLVIATAMRTELGKIASLIQDENHLKTPLQLRLADFGRRLALVILALCLVVFITGLLRGEDLLIMLLTSISLAVAAIPEALPAVVTIALAISAKRLVSKQALIRKLPAVETLGSVSYICSDKTGTLTKQQMTVRDVYTNASILRVSEQGDANNPPQAHAKEFFEAMSLNSDVSKTSDGSFLGEPTEIAVQRFVTEFGYEREQIEKQLPRVATLPFDSTRKCMSTVHKRTPHEYVSFCKGAPDVLIDFCSNTLVDSKLCEIDTLALTAEFNRMASQGLRVLAFAMKVVSPKDGEYEVEYVERGLTFLGFVGMIDPPRDEAKDSVALCKQAHIVPVMITGDHPLTATVIARELGILDADSDAVVTSRELEEMSEEQLSARVEEIRVYARVAPEQKLRIVKALQERGQYVAMTGDGVNDAPALKRADIGVAMGITGTDVSKEAASMILLDDNFATIVKAVSEGRRVYDNIRKFIKYTMTSNSGEMWCILLAPFLGLPIPLLPVHILWINLVTDGLPGLALTAEPAESGLMQRPPRSPKENIFSHGLGIHILWVGLLLGCIPIATQAWAISVHDSHWQTMVFTVLCLSQMGHVLAIRSDRESLFRIGLFSNKSLTAAFVLTLILQLATIYVPMLQPVFRTQALSISELAIALAASSVVFIAVEIEKWIRRRRSVL